jgi:hypothetical protein
MLYYVRVKQTLAEYATIAVEADTYEEAEEAALELAEDPHPDLDDEIDWEGRDYDGIEVVRTEWDIEVIEPRQYVHGYDLGGEG